MASLLACRLETGRTHQIRVHLASIGHPVMGDQVYGGGFRTKTALLPPEAQAALDDPWQAGPPCPYTDGETPLDRGNSHFPVGTTT